MSSSATAAEQAERDERLVSAIAGGDRSALAELYDRHASAMMGVAFRILKSRVDAEDLLHDVFVEAWQKARDYDRARGTVRRWLLLRVRSRGIDRVRSLATARRHAMADAPTDVERVAPADAGWGAADRARARDALERLPEEQRILVELSYFEGLTCAEMAARCEIPVGTVKSRLSAAMAKLRRRLAPGAGAL